MKRLIKIKSSCILCQFLSDFNDSNYCTLYRKFVKCTVYKRKPKWCKAGYMVIFDRDPAGFRKAMKQRMKEGY